MSREYMPIWTLAVRDGMRNTAGRIALAVAERAKEDME